ncbi:molybdopterin converting factor small subunit [Pedobacter sp. UYP30]|uniref:MoaD/ThiS family protein n=1 Tax=Pedobacter sp. UYP30 TaxID=1756400 RepID=UPI003396CDDD
MKIKIYAMLKEYFADEIECMSSLETIGALKLELIARNPSAKEILDISRFAVNNTFVALDYPLHSGDFIDVIPPSSGG